MNASLHALLSHVIDYAGLFPPAKLPLDQAIRNYARYRQEADAWMLGRFVIPAATGRVGRGFADAFQQGPPICFSVLTDSRDDTASFLNEIDQDCVGAAEFEKRHAGRVRANHLEASVPSEPNYYQRWLPIAAACLASPGWCMFLEGPAPKDGEDPFLTALREEAARLKEQTPGAPFPLIPLGYKLRCGGLEPWAFPSVEQVGDVLHACRGAGVPLKFTAGLHHPIRRFDAALQTHMHGFVNVFVAGVLARARRLDEEELRVVIADEDPAHFSFTDAGLSWKDHHASTAEIAAARRDFVTSFGSCSFDEPRDDLRALGWL